MGINEPPWHTARLGWHRAVNHVVQSKLMSKLPYAGGWAALSFASATRKYIPSSLGGVASRSVAPTATERFSAGGSAVLGSSLFFRNVPARVPQEVNRAQHWIASTNQSQHSHSTAQSQRSHSAVTAQSQHSHSTVTEGEPGTRWIARASPYATRMATKKSMSFGGLERVIAPRDARLSSFFPKPTSSIHVSDRPSAASRNSALSASHSACSSLRYGCTVGGPPK